MSGVSQEDYLLQRAGVRGVGGGRGKDQAERQREVPHPKVWIISPIKDRNIPARFMGSIPALGIQSLELRW